jgi:type VI secretion system protein VasI
MKYLALTILLSFSQAILALTLDDKAVADCQVKTISIQRLNCYDTLLNTPIHPVKIPKLPKPRKITLIDQINIQEQQRTAEDGPLLLNSLIEHADSGQQQVLITTPALGAIGIRPILAISCQRNITQLQIVLPKPLTAKAINLKVLNDQGQQSLQASWRIRAAGKIVATGRGMASIRSARELQRYTSIQLHSDQPMLDGLRFDLTGLNQQLPVLAAACHWNPGYVQVTTDK